MEYNFDKDVNRKNTDSVKWDKTDTVFDKEECLPLWVADSDWETAPEIIKAIEKRVKHGVFGYTYPSDKLSQTIVNWIKKHYNWETKKDWIVYANGVVPSINISIRALTIPGDGVLIQTPVYFPFISTVKNTGRQIVNNQLLNNDGYYTMDFNDLNESLSPDNEESCKRAEMFLLCNPHNPVGRVWKKQELQKLNKIIINNDLILVSDEIHSDFIYQDKKHIPPASLSKEIEQRSITLMAPSKTFNIAGLHTSFAVIPNEKLRRKFLSVKDHLVGNGNIIGLTAMEAAYSKGEKWLEAQLEYLWDNINYTADYLDEHMPRVKYSIPEGTYLLWLDFREYGNCSETINKRLVEKYSVALEPGNWFGEGGAGFLRMNIATQRDKIKKALDGISKMLKNYS